MARKPPTARPQTDQRTARPAGSAQPASTQPASALPRAADRIRQSARDLFYRAGIRAVGVDEIVTRAGVTKPSLYRSFPSKDELAAAYLPYYDQAFWPHFSAPTDTATGDHPRSRLPDPFTRPG